MSAVRPVTLGVAEAFAADEPDRVDQIVTALRDLGLTALRLRIEPGDDPPLDRLAGLDVVPCFVWTEDAAPDWPDARLTSGFDRVEVVDAPLDAIRRLRDRGLSVAIAVLADAAAVRAASTALPLVQAVDLVGGPDAIAGWSGWGPVLDEVRGLFAGEIWVTTGRNTATHDEIGQVRALVDALDAHPARIWWSRAADLGRAAVARGLHPSHEAAHRGLLRADGTPKLAARLWAQGPAALRAPLALTAPARAPGRPLALVTGGAGFIGCNVATRLVEDGWDVLVLDNLSRPGVERNAAWLRERHGDHVRFAVADLRDPLVVEQAVQGARRVFHFAAQVAVTTSLDQPVHDFEVNGRGTLNLLEAIRAQREPPPLVFTSTNKVYGALPDVPIRDGTRHEPEDDALRATGVSEDRPLDFHSPYGCSKGAADQYVVDYARTFGLPATVFRMSCIYGPRQFGTEDQGWVAHFLLQALRGRPITIYGDGKQVRDVLFVDDLVNALMLATGSIDACRERAFNIGGGPANTLSLLELIDAIEGLRGAKPALSFEPWRPGDQRWYVSDTRAFQQATGWRPIVGVTEGLEALHDWLDAAGRTERQAMVG